MVKPAVSTGPNVPSEGLPDLVTLSQSAAMVHRGKRTLEHYKTRGELPAPAVEGGAGMPDFWDWAVIRPWLEKKFKVKLPENFPASRHR